MRARMVSRVVPDQALFGNPASAHIVACCRREAPPPTPEQSQPTKALRLQKDNEDTEHDADNHSASGPGEGCWVFDPGILAPAQDEYYYPLSSSFTSHDRGGEATTTINNDHNLTPAGARDFSPTSSDLDKVRALMMKLVVTAMIRKQRCPSGPSKPCLRCKRLIVT